jgi:hypothetical protein
MESAQKMSNEVQKPCRQALVVWRKDIRIVLTRYLPVFARCFSGHVFPAFAALALPLAMP